MTECLFCYIIWQEYHSINYIIIAAKSSQFLGKFPDFSYFLVSVQKMKSSRFSDFFHFFLISKNSYYYYCFYYYYQNYMQKPRFSWWNLIQMDQNKCLFLTAFAKQIRHHALCAFGLPFRKQNSQSHIKLRECLSVI